MPRRWVGKKIVEFRLTGQRVVFDIQYEGKPSILNWKTAMVASYVAWLGRFDARESTCY